MAAINIVIYTGSPKVQPRCDEDIESYGFICTGIRKGYYRDNGEDALIMWKDSEDMLA